MDDVSKNNNENLPFGFRRQPVSEELRDQNWKAVEEAIHRQPETAGDEREGSRGRIIRLVRVAVVAASLTAFGFGLWWIGARTGRPQYAMQHTSYGEMKTIVLPDSSVVILNGNSSLTIPEQWTDAGGRQVWLEGEAYFQVKKQPATARKFVVHTRQLDVEVLGTRFNVNTRRERSVVSLEEGKVRLSVRGRDSTILEKKIPMVMRPGQVVVVDAARKANVSDDKTVATHSGWTRHEFHFDNTSLDEVARIIEDTYGYKMQMEDSAVMSRFMLSGDARVQNIEEMAQVLEVSTHYAVRIKDKTIQVTFR